MAAQPSLQLQQSVYTAEDGADYALLTPTPAATDHPENAAASTPSDPDNARSDPEHALAELARFLFTTVLVRDEARAQVFMEAFWPASARACADTLAGEGVTSADMQRRIRVRSQTRLSRTIGVAHAACLSPLHIPAAGSRWRSA